MCSKMLSFTGNSIDVMVLGRKSYKKWAGKERINIFIMATIFMVFNFILSPIYFMSFVGSLSFLLDKSSVIIGLLEVI